MMIRIDRSSVEPLYVQISSEIIAAIAREEIEPGSPLPSVRALARDLGINLHTVNKAYAMLRDQGYIIMRGRSAAHVADPLSARSSSKNEESLTRMENELFALALAYRARGGTEQGFLTCVQQQVDKAFAKEG